jgi:hypothetical protein
MKYLLGLLLLVVVSVGCPPPVTPTPDASDAAASLGEASAPGQPSASCIGACSVIAKYGCKEGLDPYCAGDLTKVEADRLIVPAWCPTTAGCTVTCAWCATASSPADVVARCGSSCTAPP